MNLHQLVLEQHLKESNQLLESVCKDLTQEQSRIVKGIHKEFLPLIEASLTADQVNQIFTGVQQNSRTALGKGVDTVKKVNDVINQVGGWLQNTAPVQFADQKFEKLKSTIGTKFPELDKQLTSFGTWMKENPGKSAAIIGVLTAIASLAGGPVGGAIAGQILRGSAELIKGEKLSTAVGKGIKTAVMGYLSGKAIEFLSDKVVDAVSNAGQKDLAAMNQAFSDQNYQDALANIDPKIANAIPDIQGSMNYRTMGNINGFNYNYNMILKPDQIRIVDQFEANIRKLETFSPQWYAEHIKMHNFLQSVQKSPDQGLLMAARDALRTAVRAGKEFNFDQVTALLNKEEGLVQKIEILKNLGKGIGAAVQGAIASAADLGKKSMTVTPTASSTSTPAPAPTTESQVRKLFVEIDRQTLILDEGIFDKIKQAGQRLTSKVTADQLMTAWQAAGSPMDSDQIANFLQTQGVSPEVISKVYQDSGLEAPTLDAKVDMPALIKQIQSLAPADQQKILASLA